MWGFFPKKRTPTRTRPYRLPPPQTEQTRGKDPLIRTTRNYDWTYPSSSPPSTHEVVGRHNSVCLPRFLVSRNQHVGQFHSPTLSRGGQRATTHWPQSGHHPVNLFTIPRLDGEMSTSLQIWPLFFFLSWSIEIPSMYVVPSTSDRLIRSSFWETDPLDLRSSVYTNLWQTTTCFVFTTRCSEV